MLVMAVFAVILPSIFGFLLVSYYFRSTDELSVFEKIIYGFGIGMAFVTFITFISGFLRIEFSLAKITAVMVAAVITLIGALAKSGVSVSQIIRPIIGPSQIQAQKITKTELMIIVPLTAWIIWKFFFVIFEGAILPVHAWDAWTNWSSGAKFFFYRKGLALDPTDEHFFGWGLRSHLNYPLHPFLLQVWFALCMGEIHEVLMKFWNVLYFIGTVALVYFSVRRTSSLVIAVASAFFLSTAPLLTYHALDAYAELALSFYVLSAAVSFRGFIMNSAVGNIGRRYLVLMGSFAACIFWTKLEGLFFVASFSAALLLYFFIKKIPFKQLWYYIAPISIVTIIWSIFLMSSDISIMARNKQNISGGLHFEVFGRIWEQLMFFGNFNIIFFVFLVVLIFGAKIIIRSDLKYLFFAMFGSMFLFIFVYVTTVEYKEVMTLQALDRNILIFLPMIYYLFALTVTNILKIGEQP